MSTKHRTLFTLIPLAGVLAFGPPGLSRLSATQEAASKRLEIVLDKDKKIAMQFVLIRAGTFTMGLEKGDKDETPHEVRLSKDFWMQTTETTNAQWLAVMGKIDSDRKDADLPVHCVNWEECQEFLVKLNEKVKDQLKELKGALPTEAQWEYACRAGSKGKWCFGDDEKKLAEYAWFGDGAHYGEPPHGMHPVGQKKPNAWGLFDMHGNMFEWCQDGYGPYTRRAVVDPTGPADTGIMCIRGGCWLSDADRVQSGSRTRTSWANFWGPDRDPYYGLRVSLK